MNKTINAKLAIVIIVIIALFAGGIILIFSSNNRLAQAPSQVANKPVAKNNQQSVPQANIPKIHMAFEGGTGDKPSVIYDGKDMGVKCAEIFDMKLSSNDIIFDCRQTNNGAGEGHIILNGKDLGQGFRPNVENGNVSFLRGNHLIFNSQDVGEVHSTDDWEFTTSNNHYAMERMIGGRVHVIYDGKDMGEGGFISLGENSIAFVRTIKGLDHLMYNGKDISSGYLMEPLSVTDAYVTYTKQDKAGYSYFYKNDQSLGKIYTNDMEPYFSDGNYAFENTNGNIIFDGKNLGSAKTTGNSGSRVQVSGNHIVFVSGEAEKIPHVIYDGKDLGEGVNPTISGDNIAYNIEVNGKQHILFNGKDLGEGTEPQLAGDNLAFYLEEQGAKHVIYNGKDLGEGGIIEFSEN